MAKVESVRKRTSSQLDDLCFAMTYALLHELCAPLVGILGLGALMALGAESLSAGDVRDMAETIVKSGQRLHWLMEHYLLYAQIER